MGRKTCENGLRAKCGCDVDQDGYILHDYGCWNEEQTDTEAEE
tara:strand:- start:397 stop:525 length:129 start_codon:yes stop_codon:yes gene_type:complete